MSGGGSETTQKNEPPQYIQDQHRQNLDIGNVLADRPYQPYTGPRIAGFTADQTAGMDAVRKSATGWQPGLGHGIANGVAQYQPMMVGAAQISRDGRDVKDVSAYTNPFENTVVNTTMADLQRQQDIAMNGARARAAGAGAFGGSRSAILEAELARGHGDNMARTVAGLRQSGYTQAQDVAGRDADRLLGVDTNNAQFTQQASLANQQALAQQQQIKLAAAQQMQSSGMAMQQRDFGNAQALAGIGQQQQGMNQSNLDLAYSDYMRQLGYPMDQLQVRNGLLSGPVGSTSTSNTSTDNSGQMVGSGMMAAATMAAAFM